MPKTDDQPAAADAATAVADDQPATASVATARPPRRRRGGVRRLLGVFVLLAVAAACWGAWYVASRGFTRRWREALTREMQRRGLDVSVGRVTLDPFKGLVADDVHLHFLNDRHTQLLVINQVALDVNLGDLLQKKANFLNSLDLRDAALSLPLDPADPEGPKLRVRRLHAKLLFPPDQLQLVQAEGECHRIRVSVSGTLLHPELLANAASPLAGSNSRPREAAFPSRTPAEIERRRALGRAWLQALDRVRFDRQAPMRLEVRFSGDLSKPLDSADADALRVSADLRGRDVRLRGGGKAPFRLDDLHLLADYEAGALFLRQAELHATRGGQFSAQGELRPALLSAAAAENGRELTFQCDSNLDALAAARELLPPEFLPAWFADLTFGQPPHLRASGRTRLRPARESAPPSASAALLADLQVTGHLGLGRTAWREVACESFDTDFSWQRGQWFLRDAKLSTHPAAPPLRADLLNADGRLRARLNGPVDLAALAPMLPPRARAGLGEWQFNDPPRVELTVTGPALDGPLGSAAFSADALRTEGKVAIGHARFRNIPLNRLNVEFTFASGVFNGKNLRLERDEGTATGDAVSYDFNRHEVRIDNLRANLWPGEIAPWIDPDLARDLRPYRFVRPPATVTNGLVQFFPGAKNSRLVIDANAPAGLNYTFVRRELNFTKVSTQVVFTDDRLRLDSLHGILFGGEMGGSVDLALGKANGHRYSATLTAKDLDFQKLTKLYFDYDDSKGQLEGTYRWNGQSDDAVAMRGAGSIRVVKGNVFAIPVFGPFSGILNEILPGIGKNVAHEASADFIINGGKIYNGNLVVKGTGFSMLGGGWLGFADDTMNYRMRVSPQGPVGTLLYPVSKLLEYSSQGPLGKPVWRPVILSAPVPTTPTSSSPTGKPGAKAKPTPPPRAGAGR